MFFSQPTAMPCRNGNIKKRALPESTARLSTMGCPKILFQRRSEWYNRLHKKNTDRKWVFGLSSHKVDDMVDGENTHDREVAIVAAALGSDCQRGDVVLIQQRERLGEE